MILETYIYELLHHYDCVIVPDFGAFLTSVKPSYYKKEHQRIYPPQKTVSFNNLLNINDGILVQFIKKSKAISYDEALWFIKTEVKQWKEKLSAGQLMMLPTIGHFSLDQECNIQFKTNDVVNFDTRSFGLSPVLLQQAVSQQQHLLNQSQHAVVKQRSSKRGIWKKVAIAASLVGILGLGSLFFSQNEVIKAQYSAIFNGKGVVKILKETQQYIQSKHSKSADNQLVEQSKKQLDNVTVITNGLEGGTKKSVVSIGENESERLHTHKMIVNQNKSNSYILMAGVFKKLKDAQLLLVQLHEKGFSNASILMLDNNLIGVAYNHFEDENEALIQKRLLENQQYDVWLKK